MAALLSVALLGGECAARLDDWLHDATPVWASPSRERDLVLAEPWGYRGRPHGHYRKWRLNGFGFRGPEIAPEPSFDRDRWVILGASETFGLYEEADQEYPAVLRRLLAERAEVVNAAMAGITVKSMAPYWDHWVSRFGAKRVVVYPSPLFYLDVEAPALPTDPKVPPASFQLRLVERVKDVYRGLPSWMKAWREDWVIRRQLAGRDGTWLFHDVPSDRLQRFADDLRDLVGRIRRAGAEPVLVTHAHRATWPLRGEDEAALRAFRLFFPRALPATMVAFERAANQAILALGCDERVAVIDAAAVLSGKREWFADLVHFNDVGAAVMARLLAAALCPESAGEKHAARDGSALQR
ncbi:MAG: hypothetical protein NZO58_02625 [Gemmataceae bacterium]|nr:hypothetical protein [Gemmataceae bacterium]